MNIFWQILPYAINALIGMGTIMGLYFSMKSRIEKLEWQLNEHTKENEKNRESDRLYVREQDTALRDYLMEGFKRIEGVINKIDKTVAEVKSIGEANHIHVRETLTKLDVQYENMKDVVKNLNESKPKRQPTKTSLKT